ncbi:MAG: hypothetical protein P8X89_24220 [Reinekea sp.]
MMTGWCLIVADPTTNLVKKVQPAGLLPTTFSFDARGRTTAITTGDRVTTYHYDDVTRIIVPTAQAHEFEANK